MGIRLGNTVAGDVDTMLSWQPNRETGDAIKDIFSLCQSGANERY